MTLALLMQSSGPCNFAHDHENALMTCVHGEFTQSDSCFAQTSMEVGAVCDLQDVKEAVLTARLVMQHTQHSMLAGLSAANFAVQMGLPPANLTTDASSKLHADW